jgi:hypothetical protein
VEEPLDRVVQLIGLLQPQVLQPRPVDGERRILQRPFQHRIVETIQLQREEQELRRDGGQPVLKVAVEFGTGRIGGVAGIDQPGKTRQPPHHLLDPFELGDRLGEPGPAFRSGGKLRQPALVAGLEGFTEPGRALQIGAHLRRLHSGIEVR